MGYMRIAIDGLILGGRHSGVQTAVQHLCTALGEHAGGHDVGVACSERFAAEHLGPAVPNCISAPAWANSRPGRIAYELLFLGRRLHNLGYDVLHAPAYVLPESWTGASVLTVYDLIALDFPQWCTLENRIHFGLRMPRSLRRASAIIAPSRTTAEAIGRRFPECADKVHLVYLGVGDEFQPVTDTGVLEGVRRRHNLPDHFILYVGNIEPKKNVSGMVEAFERIAPDMPHHFVIAGGKGWKCERDLRRIELSEYSDRIHVTDWVPQADLPALYTLADVLIQWSLYEGVGLPPLEAMKCGTPAIVSDGGALAEIAGQAAKIVPLDSPDMLADELKTLLFDEDERREMARRGQELVRKMTWRKHVRRVIELYEEVGGD